MGKGYLVDTNTIVDYLENKLPFQSSEFIDNIEIQFSIILRIELLVWQKASDEQLNLLNDFISASTVFGLTEEIIIKSLEIRKTFRLKLPDAIIAATAAVNDFTLLTRNVKTLKR
jgi:predicted nucleic acid-binding protein